MAARDRRERRQNKVCHWPFFPFFPVPSILLSFLTPHNPHISAVSFTHTPAPRRNYYILLDSMVIYFGALTSIIKSGPRHVSLAAYCPSRQITHHSPKIQSRHPRLSQLHIHRQIFIFNTYAPIPHCSRRKASPLILYLSKTPTPLASTPVDFFQVYSPLLRHPVWAPFRRLHCAPGLESGATGLST